MYHGGRVMGITRDNALGKGGGKDGGALQIAAPLLGVYILVVV
jgi:hypothetical protein